MQQACLRYVGMNLELGHKASAHIVPAVAATIEVRYICCPLRSCWVTRADASAGAHRLMGCMCTALHTEQDSRSTIFLVVLACGDTGDAALSI